MLSVSLEKAGEALPMGNNRICTTEIMRVPRGIDARFFCGIPDISELPGAYKNADSVRAQIEEYGLADIVDTIEPIGCVMAGDWQRNAPWRKKRDDKEAVQQ